MQSTSQKPETMPELKTQMMALRLTQNTKDKIRDTRQQLSLQKKRVVSINEILSDALDALNEKIGGGTKT